MKYRQGWAGEKSGLFEHPAECSPFVPEVLPSEMVFPQPAEQERGRLVVAATGSLAYGEPTHLLDWYPEHDVDANARLNVQLSPIVDHRQAREEYLVLGKLQGTR